MRSKTTLRWLAAALLALLLASFASAQTPKPSPPTNISYNFRTGVVTYSGPSGCSGQVNLQYRHSPTDNWTLYTYGFGFTSVASGRTISNIKDTSYAQVRMRSLGDDACNRSGDWVGLTTYTAVTVASNRTPLNENNIGGAQLTVTLGSDHSFGSSVSASSFQLVTDPSTSGLSISSVSGSGARSRTLTLGFSGSLSSSFNLKVRVVAAAHNGSANLTSFTGLSVMRAIDYDVDDDGLIEISTLQQLNAVRWDLDGNGTPVAGNATAYNAAFNDAGSNMGCPASGCTGYELANHLDFDTDGDGDVDADDPDTYRNWTRIAGTYSAVFDGNGFNIANLTYSGSASMSLFQNVSGTIRWLGLPDVNLTSSGEVLAALATRVTRTGTVIGCWSSGAVTGNRTSGPQRAAGLVQEVYGRIAASFSTANVRARVQAAGLVDSFWAGTIVASYATGSVRAQEVGGLTRTSSGTVRASYAAGAVTDTGPPGSFQTPNCFSHAKPAGTTTDNYCDTGVATTTNATGATGRSTSQLQTPTSATGIYANWDDLDVDGDGTAGENPWHFGTSSQYPVLRYGTQDPGLQRGDYDNDDDGLIEVRSLRQLNAIRWDLNGDGTASTGNEDKYESGYYDPPTGMGCPATGCTGYELDEDLDFDTDGDHRTHTNGTGDLGDAYYNGGSGWDPIGPAASPTDTTHFTATFDGNGHVIRNLFIDRSRTYVGLFAALRPAATVRALGLPNAWVDGGWSSAPLAGQSWGRAAAVWATGTVAAPGNLGGLVGVLQTGGTIVASYSTASVQCTNTAAAAVVGGLVGDAKTGSNIAASYSTGAVTGTCPATSKGGLIIGGGTVTASYWDTVLSNMADDANDDPPEGRPTSLLREPTGYTGIYADWDDQDVDGDGTPGEATDDDAWHFGNALTHPVLKFGGFDTLAQTVLQPLPRRLVFTPTKLSVNEGSSTTYTVALDSPPSASVTVTVTSDHTGLTVDTDGNTSGNQTTLTFSPANWSTAQTVTATAAADADSADEAATLAHAASGGGYSRTADLLVGLQDPQQTGTDYDSDEDGLIEIDSLAKLHAMRWDLDGDGMVAVDDTANYATAFPSAAAGMGCPDGNDADQTPDPCGGYELTQDLDFDTDDAYDNNGNGWDPIGPGSTPNDSTHFNTVFDGNGHIVRNLSINRSRSYVGLFAVLRPNAVVRHLGLPDAVVDGGWSVAPLAGQNWGRVAAAWTTGEVRAAGNVGGLVGVQQSGGTVVASYSMAAVSCTSSSAAAWASGLVGENLAGGAVAASYATGAVTGACPTNRKFGLAGGSGTVTPSYWDSTSSGIDDDNDADPPEGRPTAQLQGPTEYSGLYATWDEQDVDGDGASGEVEDDDAWHFGSNLQYPVLKVGGFDTAAQLLAQPPSFGAGSVAQMSFRTGNAIAAFQVPAATHADAIIYTVTGLPPGLSFDVDGSGDCSALRTICGTPTMAGTFNVTVTARAANVGGTRAGLRFTVVVGGIEIDADPTTMATVDAGPLALEEAADHPANSRDYAVRLTSAPSASVTITVASSDAAAATVDTDAATGLQSTLTFTTANWNTWQTVTAQAVQDADAGDESVTLTHTASGGGYATVWAPLMAPVNDTIVQEVLVDANPATTTLDRGPLLLNEATTRSRTYSVKLISLPNAAVTITPASDNPAVTVSPSQLTFTTANWGTAQTVTATTTPDADTVDEAADVTHAASGGGYDSASATLRVGVRDSGRTGTDYDTDEDGLIEISALAQLNALRWDLDGDGAVAADDTADYTTAFPSAAAGMGCPDGGDADQAPDPCAGYELTQDLDFDTDDAYDNNGSGWDPIGPSSTPNDNTHFNAVFDGNGHVIRNLSINRSRALVGLFAALRPNAVLRRLGLPDAVVDGGWSVAPLAGQNWGRVAAAWTTGEVRAAGNVGGLVGVQQSGGTVVASYSVAAVSCTSPWATAWASGLVGENLAGGTVAASYATGAVTGACPTNRKFGLTGGSGAVTASYWDSTSTGIDDDNDADSPEGRSTAQLQAPMEYSGLYATWDEQDVDGDRVAGGLHDDAWHFGANIQYPVLKFGGFDTAVQLAAQPPSFGAGSVAQMSFRSGNAISAFQVPAATHVGAITYSATGLPPGLSFDGDGSGDCSALRTVCGAPTRTGTFTVTVWAANADGTRAGLRFTVVVGGIEIDADPDTTSTVEAGPLALEEAANHPANSRDYAVRLTSAPTANVTVTVASSDAAAATVDTDAATGLQSALTFTTANWNTWQTVTAQAVQDADAGDESVTITHTASGGGYATVWASLAATVNDATLPEVLLDADPATPALDRGPLVLNESSARSGTYAARLGGLPSGTVTVTLASDNPAVTVNPSQLTFITTNWDTAQTVTATTTPDADAVDEAADVTHAASGGGYDGVSATLRVGVRDSGRTGTDYDTDEDGLIEIDSLAKLHAMRWDLDGDGTVADDDTASYATAFPGASAGMGCPDGADADQMPDPCGGYELTQDLDFDTDDAYDNGGSGWDPIGPSSAPNDSSHFNTVFDGNGHVIRNLSINRSRARVGLFAVLRPNAVVRNLGLPDAMVDGQWSVAPLAGQNWGRVAAAWTTGQVRAAGNVGGLVGVQQSGGTVVASYSTVAVSCTSSLGTAWASGLVGENLAGGAVAASYATGAVTGACPANRKFGLTGGSGAVTASYWDSTTSGINDDNDGDPPEGRPTAQLQAPTEYGATGLYATWNEQDVDGDGVAGEVEDDDAWHFGANTQYPVLKFGGLDTAVQLAAQPPSFGAGGVAQMSFRSGNAIAAFQVPAAAHVGAIAYSATGLPPGLSFDGDGSGDCSALRTVCGTPTRTGTFTVTVWAANVDGTRAGLRFTVVVGGIEIDADPDTTSTVEAGPLALEEAANHPANSRDYAVRLTAAPTGSVTVTVASSDAAAATVDTDSATGLQSTLTFTTANWNTWQTVTAQAVQDADARHESVTITHTASGGGYATVWASLAATVDDATLPEVLVDANPATPALDRGPLVLNESSARSGAYAARLGGLPSGTVTVTLASDNPAVTVNPSQLTFTTTNWSTAQTVTATTTPDADAVDEAADVTHAASGGGYRGVSAILRVGVSDAQRTGTDYDADEDGLIDIADLAQLNAMRWDLDGDGDPTASNTDDYASAFSRASAGMGCPDGPDSDQAPDACGGYELMRDLDFDTDDDGSTHTAGVGDAGDDYYNDGAGWNPFGTFATTFNGNGHVIRNLFTRRNHRSLGLFSTLAASAHVTSVGLANVEVWSWYIFGDAASGALAARNLGRISATWATGRSVGFGGVGGLVGRSHGSSMILASYSLVAVDIGTSNGWAGALASEVGNAATISTSYAASGVHAPGGSRYGVGRGSGTFVATYWDTNLTGIGDDANADPPEGRTTAQLQRPTEYGETGLYATWDDQDVNWDGLAGGAMDDAWDFGTNRQHPVLKFGGFDTAVQFALQRPSFGTSTISDRSFQSGVQIQAFQVPAAVHVAPIYTATGLPDGLSFDADGSGDCSAMRTICGAPATAGTFTVTIRAANVDNVGVNLSFTIVVRGIEIDADPDTAASDAGPLALEENAGLPTHSDTYRVRLTFAPSASVTLTVASANTPTCTVHGTALALRSLELDYGNEVNFLEAIGADSEVSITDRKPTGSLTVRAPSVADFALVKKARESASGVLAIVHGPAAGPQIRIDAPKLALSSPSYSEDTGLWMAQANVRPLPVAGNDELKISIA